MTEYEYVRLICLKLGEETWDLPQYPPNTLPFGW
jgi:hypothetical protein